MIFKNIPEVSRKIWLMIAIFLVLFSAFGLYVHSEKQIDRANTQRQESYLLADQLRQSSDDLTRMARTYVVTGDPRYKQYYQDILDIRNGKKPLPEKYFEIYWDLVLANAKSPNSGSGSAIALLDLMRQAGFTDEELSILAKAKASSDRLTALEFDAMKLAESAGSDANSVHSEMAEQMLHDQNYHQAKAEIMQPINEFYLLMGKRTAAAVHAAENIAVVLRLIFIAAILGATFMLWRAYAVLRATLGGTADEIRAHLFKIGQGDLSAVITVTPGMENSVLAGLSEMQNKLYANEVERKQAEAAINESAHRVRKILDNLFAYAALLDTNGMIQEMNRAPLDRAGLRREDVIGQCFYDTPWWTYDDTVRAQLMEAIDAARHGQTRRYDVEVKMGNDFIFVDFQISPVRDESGRVVGLLPTAVDITESRQAADQLRIAAAAFESQEGIVVADVSDVILRVNRAFSDITGYTAEEAIGKKMNFLKSDRHDGDFYAAMWETILRDGTWQGEIWNRIKSGELHLHRIAITAVRNANHVITNYVGTYTDITERKQAEDQLRIAATAFETHEAIMITDAGANILRVNQAFEKITGYSAADVIGENPRILSSGRHNDDFYAALWQELLGAGKWSGEIWDRHKSGRIYPKQTTITAVKNTAGETTQYVAIFTDISDRKRTEEEIQNLAFNDALTGLPNRRLFLDRLKLALSVSARNQQYGALLFLDLDKFKTLNDTLGHEAGDKLLVEVAHRIKLCVREIDTVARLGGDEFVVLIEDISEDAEDASQSIAQIAEKIRIALAASYDINEHRLYSSPSIGVCLFKDSDVSVDEMVKRADMAMYQAKDSGRNRVRFFDPQMQQLVETRAALESDLRQAISQQQLHLYYQIQLDHNQRPIGAEALIRWIHPLRGMVSPLHFIPVAEESSLILEIGRWVLDTACRQIAVWSKIEEMSNLVLAVNISAYQFNQPDFVDQIEDAIRRHDIEPSRLKLELTESVVLDDLEIVVAKMHALRRSLYVSLSLDDFGTGYSSLSYLKQLPLDQLKVDQSFVRDMTTDSNDAVMVKTIINMAHNFGLSVIAEGVETKAQLALLKQFGCLTYQGYLFSKPVPLAEFEMLVKT